MTPADPSATLEAIKERHRKHVSVNFPEPGICVSRCPGRWPCEAYRAASAAVAVLKLADEWDVPGEYVNDDMSDPNAPAQDCARELREAITRALNLTSPADPKDGDSRC